MKVRLIVTLIIGALVCGSAALFIVQNLSRTTQLSFDLQFLAWQLDEPVSIPILMAICSAAGLVLGLAYLGPKLISLSNQVRRLERQIALSDQGGSDEWPTT